MALVILLIVAGVAATVGLRHLQRAPTPMSPLRLSLLPPEELVIGSGPDYPFGLSLAPDGRRLVFPASKGGLTQLWLRDLAQDDLQPLAGTTEAVLPFWSPDGRAIGFFAAGKLRVVQLDDGTVRDLADAPSPRGGAWHATGAILFAPDGEGPLVRRQSDGSLTPFTTLEDGIESSHRHPQLSDDGAYVVFHVRASEPTRQGLWIAPYDEPTARRRLVNSDASALLVAGGLVYWSDGALVWQALNLDTRSFTGPSVLLGTPVGRGPENQIFATGAADVIVFGVPASGLRELGWMDRTGGAAGVLGEPMEAWDVRIAPSGEGVAVTRVDPQLATLDIWTYDGTRPLPRRISPAIDVDEAPAWSRDGMLLAWVMGRRTITMRGALAELSEVAVRKSDNPVRVTDWSPDGRWIVATEARPESRSDILLVSPSGNSDPRTYAGSPFNETYGVVSPDGRWLAYASDESGRFEIYADAFPVPGRRARLTVGGGTEPRWGHDGKEVYFRRGTEIHVVRPRISSGRLEALSSERLFDVGGEIRSFDVGPDGNRFLVNRPAPDSAPKPMTVLVNVGSLVRTARGSAQARK
jgi:Tol biopolymer transport system component